MLDIGTKVIVDFGAGVYMKGEIVGYYREKAYRVTLDGPSVPHIIDPWDVKEDKDDLDD